MKTFKKFICIFLIVVMCLTSAPLDGFDMFDFSAWFANKASAIGELETTGQCGDNAYWELNIDTGELVVSGTGSMWDYTNNGDWVFNSPLSNRSDIKKVIIGDNITKIGDMSFVGSKNIETVIMGNGIKTIGMFAFLMCDKLENLTLGNNIEVIDYGAFSGCTSLKIFSLPSTLMTIDDMAFAQCTSLTQVIIPEGTTEVGDSAFVGCENVVNISLPKTLTKIGNGAFLFSVDYFTPEKFENGVFYIDSYLIFANKETGTYCEIKSGTTLIADGAFEYSNVLQSVTIPESVKYIGDNAFDSSTIQEVYIPRNVEKIGNQAFNECESLKRIIVSSENKYYSSDDYGILYNKNKTELISFPLNCGLMEVTIPESVILIEDYAFDESNIRNIIFGSNVTTIGKYAFSWCDNITEIIIPSNVTTIDNGAFSYCDWLKSVVIPNSVTCLGSNAFSNCERLISAKLGNGITVLKDRLFERCVSLVDVNIPDTVTKIEGGVFDWCKSLKNITLPQGLESIGYGAFEGTAIEKIIIPESVDLIEGSAFSSCNNLDDIVIESNYIDLETYSITSCAYTNNKDNWSDGALYIGTILLDIKNDLEFDSFEIRNGTTCLAKSVFNTSHCDKLVEVSIPNSLKIISEQAFLYCNNITDIYYDGTLEEWKSIEVRSGNAVLGKATIHFNDGTTLSHTHNFVFAETFLCIDIYQCVCGETTYTCRHMDDDGNKICDVCQETIVPEHTCEYVEKITKEPTCVTKGEKTFTCDCGNSYTEEVAIDPNNHAGNTRVENYVAPTCVSGYSGDVYCADCGVKLETGKILPATDEHKYQEKVTKEANCKEEGEITYTCTCGDEYTVTVPKTEHIDNNSDDYCDGCGEKLSEDYREIFKSGQCGDNVNYILYTDGELVISGEGNIWEYDPYNIWWITPPWECLISVKKLIFNGNVRNISGSAFVADMFNSLEKIECNNNDYYKVLDDVLYTEDFEKVILCPRANSKHTYSIPKETKEIGDYAFCQCNNIQTIIFANSSIEVVGEEAFAHCENLVVCELPETVSRIEREAFSYCGNIVEIGSIENVTYIGSEAFVDCESLKSLRVSNKLKYIGQWAFHWTGYFYDDSNWESGECWKGALYIGNHLIAYYDEDILTYTVKTGTRTIAEEAFLGCEYVKEIIISDSVVVIGKHAFRSESIETIRIPKSVEIIGSDQLILDCYNLKQIIVDEDNINYSSDTFGVLYDKNKTKLLHYPAGSLTKTFNVPKTVVEIGENSFSDSNNLTEIYIPNSVKKMGRYAFSGCDALEYFSVPGSVKEVEAILCYGENLNVLNFEDGVESIGESAFAFCKELEVVIIPLSMKTIEKAAFEGTNITDVYYFGSEEQWLSIDISSIYNYHFINANIHYNHRHIDTNKDAICDECSIIVVNDDAHTHTPKTIVEKPTCTIPGMKYDICLECGEMLGNVIVLPASHTLGDWEVVLAPTYEADGKKAIKCTVCGEILEEEIIPKLVKLTIADDDTGVSIEIDPTKYDGEVDVVAKESFDGKAIQLVNAKTGATKTTIYDVHMTVDGVTTQPNGKLAVKIPLPEGYNPDSSFVYHVNTETGATELMNAIFEDGYMVFETDHFSYYAVVEVPDVDDCSCKCHKTSFFAKIIWKITIFFNKLLRRNKVCSCGIYHY